MKKFGHCITLFVIPRGSRRSIVVVVEEEEGLALVECTPYPFATEKARLGDGANYDLYLDPNRVDA